MEFYRLVYRIPCNDGGILSFTEPVMVCMLCLLLFIKLMSYGLNNCWSGWLKAKPFIYPFVWLFIHVLLTCCTTMIERSATTKCVELVKFGKRYPGNSFGLKFIPRQSDSFRFIPKSVSAPIRTPSNQSEKSFQSRLM